MKNDVPRSAAAARIAAFVLALAAVLAPGEADAQKMMLKCRDADGYVTYTDRGCDAPVEVRDLRVGPGSVVTGRARSGGANADPEPPVRAARAPARSAPGAGAAKAGATTTVAASTTASTPGASTPGTSRPGASTAPDDETASERGRLQAMHDEVRADTSRARALAAGLGGAAGARRR